MGTEALNIPSTLRAMCRPGALILALFWTPADAWTQDLQPGARGAYLRLAAEHFEVTVDEVTVLADWGLETDEVPVVLFFSDKAGVSPDALAGLRRRGLSWGEVAKRFGVGMRTFFLPMPQDASLGVLSRAYGEYRTRPAVEWDQIQLNDAEIVHLVNLRVLAEEVGVHPLQVLESREAAGSFVAGLARLIGSAHGP